MKLDILAALFLLFGTSQAAAPPDSIQGPWWNWNICEDAFNSVDGTCASQVQVPEGWLFLAGGTRSSCTDAPLVRTCDVPAGEYNVLIPVVNVVCNDYDDDEDGEAGREGCAGLAARVEPKSAYSRFFLKINDNNAPQDIYWLNDQQEFYATDCINKNKCCDASDRPVCEKCGGVDLYPSFGHWGYHETTFTTGEIYTYEIGTILKPFGFCPAVKYVLTAV